MVGTVNDQQATVTVNGTAAQVANRSFTAANIALSMGLNTIQVVGRDRSGNGATATVTVQRIAPILPEVRVVSGDGQSGAISTTLAQPLVATLVDAIGIPQPNRPVVFKVMQDNGSLDGGAATVSSYQTGGNTVSVVVNTNAQGQASVQWKLGSRSGAGMNRVEASAAGFSGPAAFTATGLPATPAQIVVDSGVLQTGAVSTQLPKPFVVVVTDSGHNRLANVPVTFTVTQGGGNLASISQQTDSDGRALALLTLGPIAGIANNLVEATFVGNTGSPARFSATSLRSGDPTQTTISGVVLDNSNNPIQGVTDTPLPTLPGPDEQRPSPSGERSGDGCPGPVLPAIRSGGAVQVICGRHDRATRRALANARIRYLDRGRTEQYHRYAGLPADSRFGEQALSSPILQAALDASSGSRIRAHRSSGFGNVPRGRANRLHHGDAGAHGQSADGPRFRPAAKVCSHYPTIRNNV